MVKTVLKEKPALNAQIAALVLSTTLISVKGDKVIVVEEDEKETWFNVICLVILGLALVGIATLILLACGFRFVKQNAILAQVEVSTTDEPSQSNRDDESSRNVESTTEARLRVIYLAKSGECFHVESNCAAIRHSRNISIRRRCERCG